MKTTARTSLHSAIAAILLGLATPALAQQQIPALAITSNPEFAGRRAALMQERTILHDKVDGLNAKCAAVAKGSALAASCLKNRAELVSMLNSHIQSSKDFNTAVQAATTTSKCAPVTDPKIVDACNVPSGLPKSVEAEIPDTPAGNRVRKGFEAIMDHDWNVAHAWFQDALNHDPGNAGIQRLIDLAEYTMKRGNPPPDKPVGDTGAQDEVARKLLEAQLDARMNVDLANTLFDFNRNVPSRHSTAKLPPPEPPANWQAFFDAIFGSSKLSRQPTSVSGVRD